jgi:hypothetical protein
MVRKPNEYVVRKSVKFPKTQLQTRMDIGLCPWIVIPVVVGSSPISHPKIRATP